LLADPPVLIWDEPTAGLDPAARRFTLDLIADLARTRTVIVATHILSDIDQICDHVGVMHEGRMIFSGSMRDVKQRLRRDDFHLELDGPAERIQSVMSTISAMDGIEARLRDHRTLVVQVKDGVSRAGAMAELLRTIDAGGLSLQTISSGQHETEYAYLQLLQEDSAHGFRRFDFQAPAVDHADPGDPDA
jgi:ABC-2 type transport system ATP-binding protein